MVPNKKWCPSSLQERVAWYNNFSTQFAAVAVSLGFLPIMVTVVDQDNQTMQFLGSTALGMKSFDEAVRQYRVIITEGDEGEPTPEFPANPAFILPLVRPTGIFERLDNLVKKIRLAPAYTDEIGALLGIMPSNPAPLPPLDLQPTLKAVPLPGSVVQVSFVRGKTAGVTLETKVDNAATWTEAGRFFKSPAELVIPQNAQTLPRSVQVRARYVDGNTPVGQLSAVVTTATQPEG